MGVTAIGLAGLYQFHRKGLIRYGIAFLLGVPFPAWPVLTRHGSSLTYFRLAVCHYLFVKTPLTHPIILRILATQKAIPYLFNNRMESMASRRRYGPALGIYAALNEVAKHRDMLRGGRVRFRITMRRAVDARLRIFQEKGFQVEGQYSSSGKIRMDCKRRCRMRKKDPQLISAFYWTSPTKLNIMKSVSALSPLIRDLSRPMISSRG